MKHLMETFMIEADEHLRETTQLLVALEKSENAIEEIDKIEMVFREIHSLKGAARAVNLREVEIVCQALESVLSQMKGKTLILSTDIFDLLLEAVDFLSWCIQNTEQELSSEKKNLELALLQRLEQAKSVVEPPKIISEGLSKLENVVPTLPVETPALTVGIPVVPVDTPAIPVETVVIVQRETESAAVGTETLRVSSSRLNSILLQSEEMLSVKLSATQRTKDIKEIMVTYPQWKKEWTKICPDIRALETLALANSDEGQNCSDNAQIRSIKRILDFVDWNLEFTKNSENQVRSLHKTTKRDSLLLESMVDTLLDDMKKVTMFPFSSLLDIVPKLVRDLSSDKGQKTDLLICGSEIEIDRRILDELKVPLIHLIRNCIDHGLEKPEERIRKGKPEEGKLTIEILPGDHNVELIIADDGVGISAVDIRRTLQKTNTISDERIRALSDRELISFIFNSGISTSPIITELSGRGLGLAIVREKVEKLGGNITLETTPDVGTKFRIILPLTIATFRGVLISAGDQEFVLPTMYVERVMRIKPTALKMVENREVVVINGLPVSLVRMSSVLGLKAMDELSDGYLQLVILSVIETRIAFVVDRVHHELEVLFKSLGPQLTRVRNISGATVLGSNRVVPILNVPDIIKSAVSSAQASIASSLNNALAKTDLAPSSILIVEDSITTRMLLKNILEGAGYLVQTATDGLDALTQIKKGRFDIVLSDVDMPRMNGFDLTSKIRKDVMTKDLPVILITALASREDQERGIDVGANAYIVKSMFDQNNLLDVVKRLIPREAER